MNTKIYMGNGSLEILKKLAIKRAYIICDPFMKQSGRAEEDVYKRQSGFCTT